jgi:hypothetical protein
MLTFANLRKKGTIPERRKEKGERKSTKQMSHAELAENAGKNQ